MIAAATTFLLAASLAPQTPGADEAEALHRFDALSNLHRAMLVRRIEKRLEKDGHPALRRIRRLAGAGGPIAEAEPRPHFDPAEWAPVAPRRRLIQPDASAHRSVRAEMPLIEVMPDLPRGVDYEWRRGKVVRVGNPDFRERFTTYLRGFAPGSDVAYARVLAALDRDESQRPLAEFFDHSYADRDGGVYVGITLYEAWFSGKIVEVPDVDAIPFAVKILDDRSFTSPIPGDARRDRLYEQIKDKALEHRKYRTMLEAAGAAFVRAEPVMHETYGRLVPRFHYLLARMDDDLDKLADLLGQLDREQMIALVDSQVEGVTEGFAMREDRKNQMADMAKRVREAALAELKAAQ